MTEQEKSTDLSSVLNQVSALEKKNSYLQERLQKFQEAKQQEMMKQLNTMIAKWINEIDMTDEKKKEEFMKGMQGFVTETKEDSPVWQVMCQASAAHIKNVNELQKRTEEYNALKTKVEGGTFAAEDARIEGCGSKRKEPESAHQSSNVWDEFESMCRGGGLSNFVADEKVIQNLRSEWKPI
jgi:hypothetical protein